MKTLRDLGVPAAQKGAAVGLSAVALRAFAAIPHALPAAQGRGGAIAYPSGDAINCVSTTIVWGSFGKFRHNNPHKWAVYSGCTLQKTYKDGVETQFIASPALRWVSLIYDKAIMYYDKPINPYEKPINYFKGSINCFKNSIHQYAKSIKHFKKSIHHFKKSINQFAASITLYDESVKQKGLFWGTMFGTGRRPAAPFAAGYFFCVRDSRGESTFAPKGDGDTPQIARPSAPFEPRSGGGRGARPKKTARNLGERWAEANKKM